MKANVEAFNIPESYTSRRYKEGSQAEFITKVEIALSGIEFGDDIGVNANGDALKCSYYSDTEQRIVKDLGCFYRAVQKLPPENGHI